MSDYYDRDELTRPGHVPHLASGGYGAAGLCSCGWSSTASTMSGATRDIRQHIADVDAGVTA